MRLLSFILPFLISIPALALTPGNPAPAFTAHTSEGKSVHLNDYAGKIVVLEWLNYGCPFVRKHYDGGNMQALQEEFTKKGIIWLSVISSAKGKQGYSTPEQAEKDRLAHKSHATAVILDEKGELGKLYGAQSTPHMFVVDAKGTLAYAGAIDDTPSTDSDDIKTSKNYVRAALTELLASKPVSTPATKSYGCGVKY